MSERKSEVLPSGVAIYSANNIFYLSHDEAIIYLSRADINRMYGIAFPEKRRTGECCNVPGQTDVLDTNVGDTPQPADGNKYIAEVRRVAEVLAKVPFNPEKWEGVEHFGDQVKERIIDGKMEEARAMVAEMHTAHYKGYITGLAAKDQFPNDDENSIVKRSAYYNELLLKRGLIPEAEVKKCETCGGILKMQGDDNCPKCCNTY